jgi:hypothetical protein
MMQSSLFPLRLARSPACANRAAFSEKTLKIVEIKMLITLLPRLRFDRFFFEIGYFSERNSNIQFFLEKYAQKVS